VTAAEAHVAEEAAHIAYLAAEGAWLYARQERISAEAWEADAARTAELGCPDPPISLDEIAAMIAGDSPITRRAP
jgi:hypothetical protein